MFKASRIALAAVVANLSMVMLEGFAGMCAMVAMAEGRVVVTVQGSVVEDHGGGEDAVKEGDGEQDEDDYQRHVDWGCDGCL